MPVTGLDVNSLRALAIGSKVGATPIEYYVAGRITGTQANHAWCLLQSPLNQISWKADPRPIIVHPASRGFQNFQSAGGLVVNADPFQEIETVLMNAVDLAASQYRLEC
jgi:hypothetical protein